MEVKSFSIPDVKLFVPKRIADDRGYFAETFRSELFSSVCGDHAFVQENESLSRRIGTVRGLHFQSEPHAQGKLVRCTAGALFDVAVDIRIGSRTFGQWIGEVLTPQNGHQLWVPAGFAHGFCTLAEDTVISYKVTDYYSGACDKGLLWCDADVGIIWPDVADPETLSAKDRIQPQLVDLPEYFHYQPRMDR